VTRTGSPEAEHKAREIELHRHVSEGYRLRYGTPFARVFQQAWNEALLDLLPPDVPSPALDNGCGTGILLPDLARRCRAVHGVDLSPDMLAQARGRAAGADLRVADLEALPFPDGFFRTVVCRGSLHHAPSPGRALDETHRVLAPGGLLAVSEPSDDFPPVRWARAAMYRVSPRFDVHDRAFRARGLRRLLVQSGFEVIEVRRFGFAAYLVCGFPDVLPLILHLPSPVAITRALVRLDRVLARVPGVRVMAFHVMLLARKPVP
jgi:ubiquinone/menaquinone biosynthesis C-methylase UbiE